MTKPEDILSAKTDGFVTLASPSFHFSLLVIPHRIPILWRHP